MQPVEADVDATLFLAALHVENHEVVAVFALGGDREEVAAVWRKRARRIDEAQALVVVVLRRFHEPAFHAPRSRHPPARDRRRKPPSSPKNAMSLPSGVRAGARKMRPARAPPRQRRLRDAARAIVIAQLRQERRLDRVAPVVREILERAPRARLKAASSPEVAELWRISPITSSPHFSPIYAHSACPYR